MAGLLSGTAAGELRLVPDLEFAVEDGAGMRISAAVGATRVELCAALFATGGITPDMRMVHLACETGLPVHVLVRPRPGGFAYTPEELRIIEHDVVAVLRAGAAGVVVGALAPDGEPDAVALSRIVAVARAEKPAAELTFHRAFDAALAAGAIPADALGRLEDAGVNRVLTSGGGTDCTQGIGMLARLVELGRDHAPGVQIMAGGGVTADIVPRLVTAGVHAVHSSARRRPACPPAAGAGVPPEAMDPELAAGIAVALRTADRIAEHGE